MCFRDSVINNTHTHQTLLYGTISEERDEIGDFMFVKRLWPCSVTTFHQRVVLQYNRNLAIYPCQVSIRNPQLYKIR
jgi:hypothetical protein